MTLAYEDANSKLAEVATVVDVVTVDDDEDHVGNSLLQIWKLRSGHKAALHFLLLKRIPCIHPADLHGR